MSTNPTYFLIWQSYNVTSYQTANNQDQALSSPITLMTDSTPISKAINVGITQSIKLYLHQLSSKPVFYFKVIELNFPKTSYN